jgi:hypothetical protein
MSPGLGGDKQQSSTANQAESTRVLGLHTNVDPRLNDSTQGHVWLSVFDKNAGIERTVSIWAGTPDMPSNVVWDREIERNYKATASWYFTLNEKEYARLMAFTNTPQKYGSLSNNCVDFCSSALMAAKGPKWELKNTRALEVFFASSPVRVYGRIMDIWRSQMPTNSRENPYAGR